MAEKMNVYDEFRACIVSALKDVSGVYQDENGAFYSEVYRDYRDELEDGDIAEILAGRYRETIGGKEMVFDDESPRGCLYHVLDLMYFEQRADIEHEMVETLAGNDVVVEVMEKYGLDKEQLEQVLWEIWYVKLPVEDFLRQEVCMDLVLDTGDANYEFTHNDLTAEHIESVDDFEEDSSLLWLCEQQGVGREELFAAIRKGDAHSDEVIALVQKRDELTEALKQYGYKTPRYASEHVIHTGAYQEYMRMREELTGLERKAAKLQTNLVESDISYQEYLKKHFDRFARLDPMSEEQFKVRKAEILEKTSEGLAKVEAEMVALRVRFEGKPDYGEIARLQSEILDIDGKLVVLTNTDEYRRVRFVNSVMNECNNTYGMAAVTFLVKMTLEEAIRVQEVMDAEESANQSYYYEERTGKSSIVLDKSVRCGLMDAWSGKGSVFELALIKDVEIPFRAIETVRMDRHNGNYGFMDIYGANEESYAMALKEIREIMPEKVETLIAEADSRVPQAIHEDVAQNMSL